MIQKLIGTPRFVLFTLFFLAGCGEDNERNSLSASPNPITVVKNGGTYNLSIETNAKSWNIENPASWISLSSTTGSGNATVKITVSTKTLEQRTATLTVTAGDAAPVKVTVTQVASDHLFVITANPEALTFEQASGSKTFDIQTDAPSWSASSNADWAQLSKTSGAAGSTTLTVTVPDNAGEGARTGVISITADGAQTIQITITQKGELYPNYNTSPQEPDATGMSSDAVTLASKIKLGWNIGNTLEATGGETAWGNPKVTKQLIDLVKQNGFNAIRIPCSWNQYLEDQSTAKIKSEWLNRVREVVQYCIDNDMYVLLNIHWDGGWLENNCTPEKQEANNAKQKAFWQQIATHLRDYDEHLLFASANEPNVENATQMGVLNSYHQTFIDAVRATGGRNGYRVLVVQGPSTDVDKTKNLMNTLPTDDVEDRLMVEIHYYTPWNFCGLTEDADWGKMFYYWGAPNHSATDPTRNPTWGEEETVIASLNAMKTKFIDNGIPVLMGEFSATRRSNLTGDALTLHLASRAYFLKYVTQQARARSILPFYWDNGFTGNTGSALFNRTNNTVFDQQAIDALVEGAQ